MTRITADDIRNLDANFTEINKELADTGCHITRDQFLELQLIHSLDRIGDWMKDIETAIWRR